ncbi:ribosome biogenesis protein Nop16 [Blyttiomyces helicus]|uniref:Nucleolar protein 16 n=1 Tax=Blyttiomyces helicus TaxID=388810 RepID=A0A4P9WDT2_9FUNG|nr:ribosome biogenesis protein Nop16 [Blyttiomyces helicus]|eukprot:RKO90522.1 ribosome biogenesis protein Nop16 [Blyttiomyces helicus]
MARPRARRKTRNPLSKVSRKTKNPYNVSMAGAHHLVRDNWDKKLTLKQNYVRLGLLSALNGDAGGNGTEAVDRAAIRAQADAAMNEEIEWRRIDEPAPAPSDDDDSEDDSEDDEGIEGPIAVDPRALAIGAKVSKRHLIPAPATPAAPNPIIAAMEAEARDVVRLERHASEQEGRVFGDLMRKHGKNYAAMARDLKLNKYQLSAGQLKKRIERLLSKGAKVHEPVVAEE